MDFMKEYEKWLSSPALSQDERAELEAILPELDAWRAAQCGE